MDLMKGVFFVGLGSSFNGTNASCQFYLGSSEKLHIKIKFHLSSRKIGKTISQSQVRETCRHGRDSIPAVFSRWP